MNDNYPYIKIFKLVTGHYIYDVNMNTVIKITDDNVFNQILEINKYGWKTFYDKNDLMDDKFNGLRILLNKGYLKANDVEKIENVNYEFSRTYIDNCVNQMILQVTQNCNLRCGYCPYAWNGHMERSHSNKRMSWDIAKKALDFFIENSYEADEMSLSFYGGEPLLDFALIKQCIEYMAARVASKRLTFHMTTNGTLINREFLDFMSKYDFGIYISLDGPEDIHNKNRKFGVDGTGSYKKIYENLKLICNEYPQLLKRFFFNAVWDGIGEVERIHDFFRTDDVISKFDYYNLNFVDDGSILMDVTVSDHNYNTQQMRYLDYFIKTIENRDASFDLSNDIKDMKERLLRLSDSFNDKKPLSKIRFQSGPCIPGCSKLFVDADGNLFPCEKTSDKCVWFGNICNEEKIDYKSVFKLMNLDGLASERCKKCWGIRLCKLCAIFVANGDTLSDVILSDECQRFSHQMADSIKEVIYLYEMGIDLNKKLFEIGDE